MIMREEEWRSKKRGDRFPTGYDVLRFCCFSVTKSLLNFALVLWWAECFVFHFHFSKSNCKLALLFPLSAFSIRWVTGFSVLSLVLSVSLCLLLLLLLQHISSRRHKDRVAGKPSKPKYSPYNKQQRSSLTVSIPLLPSLTFTFKFTLLRCISMNSIALINECISTIDTWQYKSIMVNCNKSFHNELLCVAELLNF